VRILITGGSGLLGQSVAAAVLRGGHAVVVYDVQPPVLATTYRQGDIRDVKTFLRSATEEHVESIIHLAGMLTTESAERPADAVSVNCGGMVNALEVARMLDLRRFVWASSAGLFRGHPRGNLLAADAAYRPVTIYDATKVLNETLATHYHDRFGIETIGLRFTKMLGLTRPGRGADAITRELIEKPILGIPGSLPFGEGGANWLWVDDASRAILHALAAPPTITRNFNIGGDIRSIRDAVAIVQTLIPGAIVTLGTAIMKQDYRLDTSSAEAELGFWPEWTLEHQLAELVRRAVEEAREPDSSQA
jgi:UDP-glucose 4-epimerase